MAVVVRIHRYRDLLERIGLCTMDQVRAFRGRLVKNHRARRDIHQITHDEEGRNIVLYLKRNHIPYRKNVLISLLRHGRVLSEAEMEHENMRVLREIGIDTPACVAVGAEHGLLGPQFSFILTERAKGVPLDDFLSSRPAQRLRDRVLSMIARRLRMVHDRHIGLPTLFARHLFVRNIDHEPHLSMIDLDRLSYRWRLTIGRQRVRDLAQLHLSVPMQHLGMSERLRFIQRYAGKVDRRLIRRIARRAKYVLRTRPWIADEFAAAPSHRAGPG